ncbi:MAG: cell division protein FtsX [Flavobacteriales bacterium]|nr:MAG: cell division protein FtsX [Flavobacteriales bacterium]
MSNKIETYQKKRLKTSYISVIISITLVLFVLGLFGFVVLQTSALSTHFKEQISLNIFLKNDADAKKVKRLKNDIEKSSYVKSLSMMSKDEAAKMMADDMGQDFVNILGTNPLRDRLDVKLKSDFVTVKKLDSIQQIFAKNPLVYDVQYDKNLIQKLNDNLSKMSYWVLFLTVLLVLITIMLINSTIRLSIYSKRFTIKTMQMVGATKGFIRRPFIWMGIKLGVISAILAVLALLGVGFYLQEKIPGFTIKENYMSYAYVFAGLLLLGILISWISTYFATKRFLNLRTDELYY